MPTADRTDCMIRAAAPGNTPQRCRDVANVVMFSRHGGAFAGVDYQRGQHILICLKHADHILTERRAATGRYEPPSPYAAWLESYTIDELPVSNLPEHSQPARVEHPRPWGQPSRTRRDNGPGAPPRDRGRRPYERA